MVVWVFESNLMWSARLMQSLRGLGHEPRLATHVTDDVQAGETAIVNLGDAKIAELVGALRSRGVRTIGHAGHKEKDLLALGTEAGVDRLATNSELTFKLETVLGS